MKIKSIKINNFGKINNKEINFDNNINLIYGKNESGKTTILKFISSMFYGANKNKNRRDICDFEQYEPWNETDYSGKINYELDDGKSFEIFRDFRKKNPKIYNESSEDVSKQFSIDKNKGSEFFKEQTGIEEELFYSSIVAEQERVKLDEKEQNTLLQKLTNLVSTGSDSVSYKKAEAKLKTKLLDEVGTDRTTEKPKNKLAERLNELTSEYNKLENQSKINFEFDENENKLLEEVNHNNNYANAIKEIIKVKEAENFERKIISNTEKEIDELEKSIEDKKSENKQKTGNPRNNKKAIILSIISLILLAITTILLFIFNKVTIINYIFLGVTILNLILAIILSIKHVNENKKTNEEEIKNKKELEILEKNLQNKIDEIENQKKLLYDKIEQNKNCIKDKYSETYVDVEFAKNVEEIKNDLDKLEEKNNELRINIKGLELERKSAIANLERMPELEEQIKALQEEQEDLKILEKSIILAKDTLEESYNEMKKSLTPKFTEKLSEISSKISGEKYKNVKFSDEEGLLVEVENGEYKKAERLSTGTIFQMYLSLRLSMAEEISEEKLPIILDEVFAYYDDERLENILTYLSKEFADRQVMIFTCSNREKEIFDANRIKYNYIELE